MIKSNIKKEFHCDIEKLWNLITDNTKYAWRSDLSKIETNSFIMKLLAKPYLKSQQKRYMRDLEKELNQ